MPRISWSRSLDLSLRPRTRATRSAFLPPTRLHQELPVQLLPIQACIGANRNSELVPTSCTASETVQRLSDNIPPCHLLFRTFVVPTLTSGILSEINQRRHWSARTMHVNVIDIVLMFVALILLMSAVLKSDGLSLKLAMGAPFDLVMFGELSLIVWEFALSGWLIVGKQQHRAIKATMLTFLAFSMAALTMIVFGMESCGCFGRWKVRPEWTFTLDILILVVLWSNCTGNRQCRQGMSTLTETNNEAKPGTRRLWTLCVLGCGVAVWLMTVVGAAALLASGIVANSSPSGVTELADGTVLLQPELWLGQSLPELKGLNKDVLSDNGDAALLFVRGTCPTCRNLVMDLPPSSAREHRLMIIDWDEVQTADYFMPLPTLIIVENGRCVRTVRKPEDIRACIEDWLTTSNGDHHSSHDMTNSHVHQQNHRRKENQR